MKISNLAVLLLASAAAGGYLASHKKDQQLHEKINELCMMAGSTQMGLNFMEGDIENANKEFKIEYLDFVATDLKQKAFELQKIKKKNCSG